MDHPDLGILSIRDGIVRYSTDALEMRRKFGFYTEEKESYESALKIVQSQNEFSHNSIGK